MDRHLKGLRRGPFIERLAHHYDQWNYIHPFREGNGRTQRVFWGRLARAAGWNLTWNGIDQAANDEASRRANDGDLTALTTMFDHVVSARQDFYPEDPDDYLLARPGR